MIEITGHSPFHDFDDAFHEEEVAILEFVLSLIVSVRAKTIKVLHLRFVRPVSCGSEELLSESYSLVVGIYPLVEEGE